METSSHNISEEPLRGALLALEARRGAYEVRVESAAGLARLTLLEGKLVHAAFGDLLGIDAARAVLRLEEGKYFVDEAAVDVRSSSAINSGIEARVSDLLRDAGYQLEVLKPKATLALGTRTALVGGAGGTIRSQASGPDAPAKRESSSPPARFGKDRAKGLKQTGYSSVPPPALAEDRIAIPLSRRKKRSFEDDTDDQQSALLRSISSEGPRSPFPPPARLPDDALLDDEVVSAAAGQLRESEIPVPSTNLGADARRQLDFLAEALGSAPRNSAPFQDLLTPFDGEVAPKSSDTLKSVRVPSAPPPSDDLLEAERPPVEADRPMSSRASSSEPQPGSVPHPDLLPGDAPSSPGALPVVGRYEVLARLKRGGMGSVYMCRMVASAGFRRLFAMKVLHSHLVDQGDALDAFFHEARVLGGLHHRNIVGIADVGSPREPYIVLDYVEGGSLAEIYRATRNKRRDPAMVITIILDALVGLSEAHRATDETHQPLGLVHCDVSPHNLLVGIDGACRLTDFGAARTGPARSEDEVIQGKPTYLAPERILRNPYDQRSDLFSMGVVLYNGLTGTELFAGDDADESLRNVLRQVIRPPSEVGWRPPACFDAVCMRALSRDPALRYQSALEMAEELRQVASDNGLLSSPIALASWVTEVLGPTLRARRIAAMRGAATEQEIHARNWATMPPPAVEGGDGTPSKWRSASTEAVSRFPGGDTSARTSSRDAMPVAPRDEAPSAVETTGPLEPPVSSRSFDDRTQILGPDAGRGRSRGERIALYVVVLAALLGVVWMVASPDSVAPFFRMSPDAAGANADPGVPREDGAPDPPPASAKQGPAGEKPGAPAGDEGEEKLVPEIQPSGMR